MTACMFHNGDTQLLGEYMPITASQLEHPQCKDRGIDNSEDD